MRAWAIRRQSEKALSRAAKVRQSPRTNERSARAAKGAAYHSRNIWRTDVLFNHKRLVGPGTAGVAGMGPRPRPRPRPCLAGTPGRLKGSQAATSAGVRASLVGSAMMSLSVEVLRSSMVVKVVWRRPELTNSVMIRVQALPSSAKHSTEQLWKNTVDCGFRVSSVQRRRNTCLKHAVLKEACLGPLPPVEAKSQPRNGVHLTNSSLASRVTG